MELVVQLVVTFFFLGMASLTAVWALLRKMTPRTTVLLGALTALLLTVSLSLLGLVGQPQGLWTIMADYFGGKGFEEHWKLFLQRMSQAGFLQVEKLEPAKQVYLKYFYWALPAWVCIRSLVEGLLAYYIASLVFSRITPRVPKPLSFRLWVLPEPLIFGLIGAAMLKLWAPENGWMDILGGNLLVLFLGLYALTGLSIVAFFFHKWNLRPLFRVAAYGLVFAFAFDAVFCLGVLDVWFDIRKIKKPQEPAPAV
jgi:hypothetical protein